jgi:hypothetical protein
VPWRRQRLLAASTLLALVAVLSGCDDEPSASGVSRPDSTFEDTHILDYPTAIVPVKLASAACSLSGPSVQVYGAGLLTAPNLAEYPRSTPFIAYWSLCNHGDQPSTAVVNGYQFQVTARAGAGTMSFSEPFDEPLLQPCACKHAYVEFNNPGRMDDDYPLHRSKTLESGAYDFSVSKSSAAGKLIAVIP